MQNHLHLEALRTGAAQVHHLGNLAQAAYLARFLCEAGYGKARSGLFDELDKIIALTRRAALATGVWQVDEPAFVVLGEMLTLHDQQLAAVAVFALSAANERLTRFCADGPSQAHELVDRGDSVAVSTVVN